MSRRREWLAFALFVAPGVVLFGAFSWWPVAHSLYLSVTDWRLTSATVDFVGLENYVGLLNDARFWRVSLNTAVYAVSVVVAAQVLAFGLAALLARPVPGRGIWRALAFTPYVTMPVAAAIVWVMLLDPRLGPLSAVYGALGVEGPRWVSHGMLALGAIILVGVWKEAAFGTVFYVAGRQNLGPECFEAARLDGAGAWATLRHVTLPLLAPVTLFLVVSGLIAASKVFDTVALMTGGGPVYPDSSTFVYHLYALGFQEFRFGMASAFAVIFVALLSAVSVAQFRAARRWVHFEG